MDSTISTGRATVDSDTGSVTVARIGSRKKMKIEMRSATALSPGERNEMFGLLDTYYANAHRRNFERDLAEKEWVLLGSDPDTEEVLGFSTLMRSRMIVDGSPIVSFFSGDTIVESDAWGSDASARGVGMLVRHMLDLAEREAHVAHYWFLISSTYKSYRLLPLLFQEFHPVPSGPMPDRTARLLRTVVEEKFGQPFDPDAGVIRYPDPTLFRWDRVHSQEKDRSDPYVRLFLEKNPGYREGDRLASLTELRRANLTRLGRRLCGIRATGWEATAIVP